MGPGQGTLGKVGQDAELIFPPLPQGHPELINCWSRVRLAEAPSGPGVFLSRTADRSPGLPLPVSGVRVPGGTEPDVGSPASARRGCRRPRDPSAAV